MQQNPIPPNQKERHERLEQKALQQSEKTAGCSRKFQLGWGLMLLLLVLVVLGWMAFWNQKQVSLLKAAFDAETQQRAAMKAEWIEMKHQFQVQQVEQVEHEQLQKTEKLPSQSSVEYKIVQTQQPQSLIYLIQLAQQSLKLQKNVGLALQSLRLAMGQVSVSGDEVSSSLKHEMEKQIHRLEAIDMPNEEVLIEQLNDLANEAGELSVVQTFSSSSSSSKEEIQKKPPSTSTPTLTHWERLKQTFSKLLKQAVIVRNEPTDAEHSNTFVPSQAYLIGQLQLWLLKAEWAIFQRQDTVYQNSLNQALNLLKRSIVQGEQKQAMINKLEQLKLLSIDPKLPDLSDLIARVAATEKSTGMPVEIKPKPAPDQNQNPNPNPNPNRNPDPNPNHKEMPAVSEQKVLSS